MRYLLLSLLYFLTTSSVAQDVDSSSNVKMEEIEMLLDFYGDAMMNSYQEYNRQFAYDKFSPILKGALERNINFDSITGINIIQPKDQSFKLYSWQLEVGEELSYYAFLLTEDGDLFEFVENNTDFGHDFKYYIHSPSDWYGSVYYKIREEKHKRKKHYIISGFKKMNAFTKMKVVDVLYFDEEGNPNLGKEIFHKSVPDARDDVYTKLMITYDASAYVDYNYNKDSKRLVFDHLISKSGILPGQGMTKYPDGTYDGYQKKSGKYYFIENTYQE